MLAARVSYRKYTEDMPTKVPTKDHVWTASGSVVRKMRRMRVEVERKRRGSPRVTRSVTGNPR